MDDWRVSLFLEEWKHGWDSTNPVVREANRLSMRRQLLDLIVGTRIPPPVKPGRA